MKTKNFIKLINAVTGRDFQTNAGEEIKLNSEYYVFKILPINQMKIGFMFKTPKREESLIKSFITQYSNKYLEPNPAKYDGRYGGIKWENKTDAEKEFAYMHHRSNMYSKQFLLGQLKENAVKVGTQYTFSYYGFYSTNYGIGLYVLFSFNPELAVNRMRKFLDQKGIPYHNEYSDAKWVYRFVININKDIHEALLGEFSNLK